MLEMPIIVHADSVQPQFWRNGGGQTRELLALPAGPDWSVRISRADIDRDGPFSPFAGVERWFTVLHGAGVVLGFADRDLTLRPGDAPACFDGDAAPGCRLLDGATQDLNLMVRGGTGFMRAVQPAAPWQQPCAMRGIYTSMTGQMRDGQQTWHLPAHTLLWMQGGGSAAWAFEPDSDPAHFPGGAWWLGVRAWVRA